MSKPSRTFRIGAILWALLIGAGVVFLGASIMLPSTKRARFDFKHQPQSEPQSDEAATTAPAER